MSNFLDSFTEEEQAFLLASQRIPNLPGVSTLDEDVFRFALQYIFHGNLCFHTGHRRILQIEPPYFFEHMEENGKFSIYFLDAIKLESPITYNQKRNKVRTVKILSKVPEYEIMQATAIGAWEISDEGLARILERSSLPTLRHHANLANIIEKSGYESLSVEEKRHWEKACRMAQCEFDNRFARTAILAYCEKQESWIAELAQKMARDVERRKSRKWRSPEIRSDFRRFRN